MWWSDVCALVGLASYTGSSDPKKPGFLPQICYLPWNFRSKNEGPGGEIPTKKGAQPWCLNSEDDDLLI